MTEAFDAVFAALQWFGNRSAEQVGNMIYLLTLVIGVFCIARGHRQGKINLWELVTATDRSGVVRTDGRKLFEVIGMSVMVITFYFLTITARLSEWYVLIFAVSVIGARIARDIAQIKQAALGAPHPVAPPLAPSQGADSEPR